MNSDVGYPFGRVGLITNLIFLLLSILAVFWFFEPTLTFLIILAIYLLVSIVFTIIFYFLKIWLLKTYLPESTERSAKPILLLFLLLFILNFVVLFLIPNLWLIFISGLVAGVSISEIVVRYRYKSRQNR